MISFLLTSPETQMKPFKLESCPFLTLLKFSSVDETWLWFLPHLLSNGLQER